MVDISQLPHLVRLLDDQSPAVRDAVLKACDSFGDSLETELLRQGLTLSESQEEPIRHLLDSGRRSQFRQAWSDLENIEDDKKRLEAAMQAIVLLQYGLRVAGTLPAMLDELATMYKGSVSAIDALTLSRFLFRVYGMTGAGSSDYLNPLNSNLVYVVEEKRGLPISLACVFMLVGHRLDLPVEGCNFPGHFLAIAPMKGKRVLIDCYNRGRRVDEVVLARINGSVSLSEVLRMECGTNDILARLLRNLIFSYKRSGNEDNLPLLSGLLGNIPQESGTLRSL
ncbi:MAG: transglutaminase-like domain-containing protein [Ignavibacteria bacterium]|nr:transglutaminase-like domain-containing protein [Ignavibacteria bacterium]